MKINLEEIIISLQSEDITYLDMDSEELAYVEDEYIYYYGSNRIEDFDELDNDNYLALPNRDYVDSYRIMKDYVDQKEDGEIKRSLETAIKGRGAFRIFRICLERFHLENEWYKFRDKELKEIAINWCIDNGLSYYENDISNEIDESETKDQKDNIKLIQVTNHNKHNIVYLVMEFRNYLDSLHGYETNEDEMLARNEIDDYFKHGYPIYAISVNGLMVAYSVLRIEDDVVWLESLFVREEYRKRGFGRRLFEKAEEIANEYGNDTLYNYIHPNNELMIRFLKEMDYDVINLLEIRKRYKNEEINEEYQIGNHTFKYKGK